MRLIRSRSQVFLRNQTVIEQIINCALDYGHSIVEIGCGDGALTVPLAQAKIPMIGFEIDPRWCHILNQKLVKNHQVKIINSDFLVVDFWSLIINHFSIPQSLVIISNLPYHISKKIISHLFKITNQFPDRISGWILMMQAELADRFLAPTGKSKHGFLSVVFQYFFNIKLLLQVPRESFHPKPKVASRVLIFTPNRNRLIRHNPELIHFVYKMFNFRRKMVINNLKRIVNQSILNQLQKWQPDWMQLRPQNLTFTQFTELYSKIKWFKNHT